MSNLITLVQWSPQAIYSPKVDVDECTICKEVLTLCCSTCQESKRSKCPASMGKCGHCFHYHCIQRWMEEGGGTCPIDKTVWRYECEDTSFSAWKTLAKPKEPTDTQESVSKMFEALKGTLSGGKLVYADDVIDSEPPLTGDLDELVIAIGSSY